MTSVRNLLPPLSGNKILRLCLVQVLCLIGLKPALYAQEYAARAPIKVQLLLPLQLDEGFDTRGSDAQWQRIAFSYYQGILMALDSLEKAGIRVELHVDDTRRDSLEIIRILNRAARDRVDIIIGPFSKNKYLVAEPIAIKNKIPVFSPFLTFQGGVNNTYLIMANPSIESYGRQLSAYIGQQLDSCNVLLLHDNSKTDKSFSSGFMSKWNARKNNTVRDLVLNSALVPANYFSANRRNLVVMPSMNEKLVNNILYKINDTVPEMKVSVLGLQGWLDFKNINYKVWDSTDVHLLSPYFVNFQDSAVKVFIGQFRDRYHSEPDEYAIRGYDQFLFLMTVMQRYGKDFLSKSSGKEYPGIHTHFNFTQERTEQGWENRYLNIIRFNEFRFYKLQ